MVEAKKSDDHPARGSSKSEHSPRQSLKGGGGQYLRPVRDQIRLHAIAGSIVVVFGSVEIGRMRVFGLARSPVR